MGKDKSRKELYERAESLKSEGTPDDMKRDSKDRNTFCWSDLDEVEQLLDILNNRELEEARIIERGAWDIPLILDFGDIIIELSNGEDGSPPCFKIFD